MTTAPAVALSPEEIRREAAALVDWSVLREGLVKTFDFPNRRAAAAFLKAVLADCNSVNHHPDAEMSDNHVTLTYITHATESITDKDFDAAAVADSIAATTPALLLARQEADIINLPDNSAVQFPTLIGAMKPGRKPRRALKPGQHRRPVLWHGLSLGRPPTPFEARVVNLSGILERLLTDHEQLVLQLTTDRGRSLSRAMALTADVHAGAVPPGETNTLLREAQLEMARYGASEVRDELRRQGAFIPDPGPRDLADALTLDPLLRWSVNLNATALTRGWSQDMARHACRLQRCARWTSLKEDWGEAVTRSMASGLKAVGRRLLNEALGAGRRAEAVRLAQLYRQPGHGGIVKMIALAQHLAADDFDEADEDDELIDYVIQTAVIDAYTCEPCEKVDGDTYQYGSDEQVEAAPPYYLCHGEDNCRCVVPETPVWMGDFSYRAIGDVKVGDTVIGWRQRRSDDPWIQPSSQAYSRAHGGLATLATKTFRTDKLVRTKVTHVNRLVDVTRTITLASGLSLRCTLDHEWLARTTNQRKTIGAYEYVQARDLVVGRRLARLRGGDAGDCPPELQATAAWLGGIYDGEGCGMGISQSEATADGAVIRAIQDACDALGFETTVSVENSKPKRKGRQIRIRIGGGRAAAVKFARWVPSIRFRLLYADAYILTSRFRWLDEIVAIEDHSEQSDVVCLTTGTGNYVANGACSHNCLQLFVISDWRDRATIDEDPQLVVTEKQAARLINRRARLDPYPKKDS